MKGLENSTYLAGYIFFNALAILFVVAAIKRPRLGRLLFFLLFSWASVMNWSISQNDPMAYQEYAIHAFSDMYKEFIKGWFRHHTEWMVGTIATCQGLIAISMLLKGSVYKIGAAGAILFLSAIAPLGVGSGFPCTIVFSIAMFFLFNKGKNFIWVDDKQRISSTMLK